MGNQGKFTKKQSRKTFRFREHLRDIEKDDKHRHLNRLLDTLICRIIPSNMPVCSLSLHQGSTERRKTLEQKLIFQIGTLNPHGINESFSFN